jgi:hypothetical protein
MVPLAATPRSVATGHQDVASPDSTLELRLLRRSARTGTQAPSRDRAHAAGAEATSKLRVSLAAPDMALVAAPVEGAAQVAPDNIAADG